MKLKARPAVGSFLTLPARRTIYNAVPGAPVPLNYHVGPDGNLWTNEEVAEVIKVRKQPGRNAVLVTLKRRGRVEVEIG